MARRQRRRRRVRGRRRLLFGAPLAVALLVALVLATAIFAFATTISMSTPPRLGSSQYAVGPNDVKPTACGGINVTNLVTGNTGTAANDLIYATGGWLSTVSGGTGDDCIIVSTLTLRLDGGGGANDVCIGTSHVWWQTVNCEATLP